MVNATPPLAYVDYAGNSRPIVSQQARQARPNEIPIVDVAPFLRSGATELDKKAVVDQVYDACHNVGFLYIKGHGLSQDAMDAAFAEGASFFALSEEQKMETYFKLSPAFRVSLTCSASNRSCVLTLLLSQGYEPQKGANHPQGHLKEAFNIGYEPRHDAPEFRNAAVDGTHATAPNVWPSAAPGLRPAYEAYFSRVIQLGRAMIRIFALALDLQEDYFAEIFKQPGQSLFPK